MAGLAQHTTDREAAIDVATQSILGGRLSNLLHAALNRGPEAANAYRRWRSEASITHIDFTVFRLLPLLVETITRHEIDEPELPKIRGAAKQTWLKNMIRARHLERTLDILTSAGVEALVMKGAAMFARFPQLGSARGCGDYDVLVQRRDAPIAVKALLAAGFEVDGVRMDLFAPADFEKIHGMHFAKRDGGDTVDVHWWPLPDWFDEGYVHGLFARAEISELTGHAVLVPRLEDHLFLSMRRVGLDDRDEVLLRTVESALLVRACDGRLDWQFFVELMDAYRGAAQGVAVLRILEGLDSVPLPRGIVADLTEIAARHATSEQSGPAAVELLDAPALWREYAAKEISFETTPVTYLHGFSFPENLGRWTDGRFAALAVQVNITGPVSVHVEVRPFLPPGTREFSFSVFGGAHSASPFTLSHQSEWVSTVTIAAIALPFPAAPAGATPVLESASPKGLVILVFELADAGCPRELGLSTDPRRLGLLVGDIRVAIER